ncbi:MAG: TVP38/TMEM64 family protein [Syntrophomonadaceae bacterium]|nr:TVP38/TMEM64 family protein [Syntrophomonadaceae bacterium]
MVDSVTIDATVNYIRNYHALAPLVTFGLFFLQAVLPVFPYMILAGAAGMLFGFWEGFLLSWLGALLGACVAFQIARALGKDWFVARINERYQLDLEAVDPKYGFWGIVIARVFPVVPTPLINVAAGVGGVSFWVFTASSALGKLPTALIYTGIGYNLYRTHDIKQTLVLIALVLLISYVGISHFRGRISTLRRHARKREPADEKTSGLIKK